MTTVKKRHAKVHRRRHAAETAAAMPAVGSGTGAEEEQTPAAFMEPERRHERISEIAYFLAEERDFTPGHELDDWLAAEHEIDQSIAADPTGCG